MKSKCPHCGVVINPAALLGAKTSAAKAASSRANAKLGGWPKGKPRKPKRAARLPNADLRQDADGTASNVK